MILSSHVAAGFAVGVTVSNPIAGFLLGLVSHHLLDLIPHTDIGSDGVSINNIFENKNSFKKLLLDGLFTLVIILVVLSSRGCSVVMLFSVLGAIFPDIIDNSPFWSPYLRRKFPFNYYHYFHGKFHFTIMDKRYFYIGYITQIMVVAISLYLVVK